MIVLEPVKSEKRERHVAFDELRAAQSSWRAVPVCERLRCVKRLRTELAENCTAVARELSEEPLESLTAQLIPFLDACRFLERKADGLLAPRKLGRSPFWLWGVTHEVRREPHGVVLILGPSNYPFFLPAVQALQALVAGNAVAIKPGDNGTHAAQFLVNAFAEAGFPRQMLLLLPETQSAGKAAIAAGPDKIVLTGSVQTGIAVLAQAAPRVTPCTMELSGCDAVFVLHDADLKLAARAIAFGVRLNGGRTCIAPRRLIVWREVSSVFQRELIEALDGNADILSSELDEDEFGGDRLSLTVVNSLAEAIQVYEQSKYRLGASIFSSKLEDASQLAEQIDAGSICINDLIVPTADGRIPFAGRARSGFGATRGAEGLLEMTRLKVVSIRAGAFRPHLRPKSDRDFPQLARFTRIAFGNGFRRWRAIFRGDTHD